VGRTLLKLHRDPVLIACYVAWLVLPVIAAVRAIGAGWYPIGDEALIAIRARDVLTEHHPLLGTAASAALGEGYLTNHPGPLLFDLAAAPVRLFGSGSGLVIAIAAINFGAGIVAILAAARQAGRTGAVATTIGLGALVWSAGNQVLIEPYNPTASMVPFFAVLVLAWAAANGDRWALPWLVALGSFCVQTNLAYTVTALPIVVAAIGAFAWRARGQRPWRTIAWRCLPIGAVIWFQPALEQLVHGRDGHVARLARASSHVSPPLGLVDGTKRAASVISIPPAWLRGWFDSYALFDAGPRTTLAFASLLALVSGLVAIAIMVRRRDEAAAMLLACSAGFVFTGWLAAVRVPLSPFFGFTADYVRWLWPIAVMCPVAIGMTAGRALLRAGVIDRRMATVAAMLVLGLAAVAASPAGAGPRASREWDRVRAASTKLNALGVQRLPASGAEFDVRRSAYHIGYPLFAAMQENGIPFYADDPISIRQFGAGRRPPDEAVPVFHLVVGLDALDSWDRALVCVSELDSARRARLGVTRDALADALAAPGFSLSAAGRRLAATALAPTWMSHVAGGRHDDALAIVNSREFATLLGQELLVPPAAAAAASREFVELRLGLEDTTACIVPGRDPAAGNGSLP
jgi:hypothetical protein